jgi:hypothetical protein
MRIIAVLALVGLLGCSSEKKFAKIRFLFDVDVSLVDKIEISIGGKSVTLSPPVPNVGSTSGYLDFDPPRSDCPARVAIGFSRRPRWSGSRPTNPTSSCSE